MHKIKFVFELNNGKIITNDIKFDEEFIDEAETDEEVEKRLGCVVYFDKVPMLQDYQQYVNKIWCGYLQFIHSNGFGTDNKLKKVTTVILD